MIIIMLIPEIVYFIFNHFMEYQHKAPTELPWPTLQVSFRNIIVSRQTTTCDTVNKHLHTKKSVKHDEISKTL